MPRKELRFRDPIYKFAFSVRVESAKVHKRWAKKHGSGFSSENTIGATHLFAERRLVSLWLEPGIALDAAKGKPFAISVLAHEVCHAAMDALTETGVVVESRNSEPTAYYIEWLTWKILRWLRKRKDC